MTQLVRRWFPLLATLWCVAALLLLEGPYEQLYVAHYHQAMAETAMAWNRLSLDLLGNPMMTFGIHVINPQLSPTFWIGHFTGSDLRIPVQAAFQCLVMLFIVVAILRSAGVGRNEAFAIGAVAMGYCWIPFFSGDAMTPNSTQGLFTQEGCIATLLAFYLFTRIGVVGSRFRLWPPIGLALTVIWFSLSVPYMIPFFVLSTAFLCFGALCAVQSRKELLEKVGFSAAIVGLLLLAGYHKYVLNLFTYTPQMYYEVVLSLFFAPLSLESETLLLGSLNIGGLRVWLFFVLAAIGAVSAWHFENRFARYVVAGAVAFEALVHVAVVLNVAFKISPMTFLYVELMGLPVVAILAGVGCWTVLRAASDKLGLRTSPIVPLLVGMVIVLGTLALRGKAASGWPPDAGSAPAQVQIKELRTEPGDRFRGRSITLLSMDASGPNNWDVHFYPILDLKYRPALRNDLTNDARAFGVPVANEFGHWMSPPMLALQAAGFYERKDLIGRATQAPRVYRANLARAMGVALVVSDKPIAGETRLYEGTAGGHPLYIHKVGGTNLGQYSPTRTALATQASAILDILQAPDFDGTRLAVVETPLAADLVAAENVAVRMQGGPVIHVSGRSAGTSLLVLPFDYSHCLRARGGGLQRVLPANLALVGLLVRSEFEIEITYKYGLFSGTSCRRRDLERARALGLEKAAAGRLFNARD